MTLLKAINDDVSHIEAHGSSSFVRATPSTASYSIDLQKCLAMDLTQRK